ncbi:MAG: DUF4037 domain-containing protein [Lachnospiraceae bacterium]|nr:DUF4037 domain-containing protein [Lachnospiraceae bacterium]MBQ9402784.1 DUF4037 domain-containing protein [Clostridia bacterium]
MKGLELSRKYFEEYGLPMLEEGFPELMDQLAAGLFGSGSECFGFDDEISRDHDFEPGFCILLPDESLVDRRQEFQLERAYARLPKEFMGCRRLTMQPVGGARHGVFRTAAYFLEKTGSPDGRLSTEAWLRVPEHALAEAVNGELYLDRRGEVSEIRQRLAYYPEDIRLKKLAGHLLLMAQAGQYNYQRSIRHGEEAAAQLAVFEFVKSAIAVIFLLNRRYQPYYKWSFRALRELPLLSLEAELLEYLLTTGNDAETAEEKYNVIEGIAADVIDELMARELTAANCGDLEKHAYSVNDRIADAGLRNMHILAAV